MTSARKVFVWLGAVFLLFGLTFMGSSLAIRQSNQRLMETGVSAQGVFTRVGKSNTWFQFEADGQVWEIKSNFYSSSMHPGDPVTVWYPAGAPEKARMTDWITWGAFLIGGGSFAVIGAGFLAVMLIKFLKKKSLLLNGTPVTAQVTDVVFARYVKINHRHPYVIRAVCIHPYTGQEMKVKSEYLMENPWPYIQNNEVTVLVDPMRENRYYMQIEKIRKGLISKGDQ